MWTSTSPARQFPEDSIITSLERDDMQIVLAVREWSWFDLGDTEVLRMPASTECQRLVGRRFDKLEHAAAATERAAFGGESARRTKQRSRSKSASLVRIHSVHLSSRNRGFCRGGMHHGQPERAGRFAPRNSCRRLALETDSN